MKTLSLMLPGLLSLMVLSSNVFGASLDLLTQNPATPGDKTLLIARTEDSNSSEWEYLVLVPNWLDEVAVFGFKDYRGTGPLFMGRVFHGQLSVKQTFESTQQLLQALIIREDFTRMTGPKRLSAMTSVMTFVPKGAKPEWMGENHGNEELVSAPTLELDGVLQTLMPGEVRSSNSIQIHEQSRLLHSQVTSKQAPEGIALKTITYSTKLGDTLDLRAQVKIDWKYEGILNNYYIGMLDAGYIKIPPLPYTHVRIGDILLGLQNLADDNNTPKANSKVNAMGFVRPLAEDPTRQLYALVHLPNAEQATNHWSHSSPNFAFVMDRNTGGEKLYFGRSGKDNPEAVANGQTHEFEIGWQVRTTELDLLQ